MYQAKLQYWLQDNLNMENVLSHPLGPVPWSLATADGALVKTNKAKLLHALETEQFLARRPEIEYMNCIIDGNAILPAQVVLLTTFGELAEKVFDQLPKVSRVDFVTDTYRIQLKIQKGGKEEHQPYHC